MPTLLEHVDDRCTGWAESHSGDVALSYEVVFAWTQAQWGLCTLHRLMSDVSWIRSEFQLLMCFAGFAMHQVGPTKFAATVWGDCQS